MICAVSNYTTIGMTVRSTAARIAAVGFSLWLGLSCGVAADRTKVLNVYAWSEYFPAALISAFQTVIGFATANAAAVPFRAAEGLHCGGNARIHTETTLKLKLAMPKSTCSQHYRILREAGLIVSERRGVDLSSRVRAAELEARFPGLLDSILKSYTKETARRDLRSRRRV
jgi:DNA-binding transcriptional ArsR family regulator